MAKIWPGFPPKVRLAYPFEESTKWPGCFYESLPANGAEFTQITCPGFVSVTLGEIDAEKEIRDRKKTIKARKEEIARQQKRTGNLIDQISETDNRQLRKSNKGDIGAESTQLQNSPCEPSSLPTHLTAMLREKRFLAETASLVHSLKKLFLFCTNVPYYIPHYPIGMLFSQKFLSLQGRRAVPLVP